MRTTVTLGDDVAAAVERVRQDRGIGMSEAINDLVRAGLVQRKERPNFVQKTYPMGLMIDVSNVAEALEQLDGPEWR